MPGIYGYVKQKKDDNQLENMTKKLYHHKHFMKDDDFSDECLDSSHLHLGKMKKDTSIFVKDGIYISIEGEQYDYKNDSFEELLFQAFTQNYLESFLNKLDGYFNAVIYDSKIKKLYVISDRYGMRMLYYYFKDGKFAFSGEVKGLLGLDFVDASIDEKQIECFMDLGYLVEDNTYHKHIQLIKPATIMEFDISSKKLTQKYYWKWSEIKQQDIPFDEAVDKLGELWLKTVEKRFDPNEKIGISLSGGLDSRAIFAAVNKINPDYNGIAYTFGIPNCDDIKIAKRCVNQTKWNHKEFYLTSKNWFEPRKEKVWFTDGMMPLKHMHGSEFLDEVSEKIDFNLNGYAGDVVLGGGWFSKVPLNTRATKENLKGFYKKWIDICDVDDEFYNIDRCEPHLYINRVRRFTNMGTVNGLVKVDQRKPFFDNDLIEFIYSISDEYRKDNKLYSKMLLKFFPEFFKEIPWQNTGKTIDKKTSSNKIINILKKIKRIPFKFGLVQDSGYTNYIKWIEEKSVNKELHKLLDRNNAFYSKYISTDFKGKYLEASFKGLKNYDEIILRASTIEIYLQKLNNKDQQ